MMLLLFLVILSVLVMVHELGHFVAARRNGILVEEFGFGLPPRVFGKRIGETLYSINLLPIGGFVKLYGEEGGSEAMPGLERAFFMQKKRVRALVLTAGVIMNFLLGVVLFSVVYTSMGIPTETNEVSIVGIVPGSPAEEAGIKLSEVVFAVDGDAVESTEEFVDLIDQRKGKDMELSLGEMGAGAYGRMVTAVPRENPPEGEGALGVVVSTTQAKFFPMWEMPFRGAWFGLKEAVAWGVMIVAGLWGMIRDLFVSGVVPQEVAGPVGIFQLTGMVAGAGILPLLQFVGVLSVNLAVLNILPFPALDGGRLVFLGFEAVTGKKVGTRVEQWTHGLGMAVLLLLMVLVTLNDVVRISGAGSLMGLVQKVLRL